MISFERVRVARRALATALCVGLLAVLPLAGVQAQEKPAAPPPATGGGNGAGTPQGNTITAPTYKIAPEDTLMITVVDRPELTRNIQVLTDGTIDMPDVGEVKVVGMTIGDLKKEIQKRLARKYNRPQVNVAVAARQLRQANIFGAVANKGKMPLREGWRVRDVIAQANGLASMVYPTDRYEFFRAELVRAKGGEPLPIDLGKLLGQGDDAQNYPVEADDTITIREIDVAEANVTVVGMVQKPGAQLTPRSGNIVDVVVAAGPLPEVAMLSAVEVVRKSGEKTTVDLRGINKPGFTSDFRVQPGDRITIPENKQRYYLLGNFARPGEQVYPDDPPQKLTVYNVISKSGQIRGAELKKTKLLRPTPGGNAQEFVVDVEKMMKTGDFSKDMEIKPGDSVVVPDTPRSGWDRLWPIVQVLSIGLGLYFTVKAL